MSTMSNVSVIEAARRSLGPVGAYLPVPFTAAPPLSEQRAAVTRLEQAGYRAAWINEPVGGKDTLVQAALLLESTEQLVIGTGIANIWARAPQTAHGGAAMLAQAYPGRLVLGLGVGYPQQAEAVGREFGRPVAVMRDYLARMTAPTMTPAPDGPYARILAANGPQMQALAAELADGAMPAGMPPGFTAQVREAIGPDRLLVVGMSVILETADRDAAREAARAAAAGLLARPWSAAVLARLGYRAEPGGGVSDELVDTSVGYGDPAAIAALAAAHRDAGADHVILMSSGGASAGLLTGIGQLEALAPAVLQVS
jgi:probable F420-dependent oxidoreductase